MDNSFNYYDSWKTNVPAEWDDTLPDDDIVFNFMDQCDCGSDNLSIDKFCAENRVLIVKCRSCGETYDFTDEPNYEEISNAQI
jgi:hypothetical protein